MLQKGTLFSIRSVDLEPSGEPSLLPKTWKEEEVEVSASVAFVPGGAGRRG